MARDSLGGAFPQVPARRDSPSLRLCARWLWAGSGRWLEDAAVVTRGQRLVAVGRRAEVQRHWPGPWQDLGDTVLLPGLINAHCHLDYTHMAGQFPPPRSFCDWIKLITTEKAIWTRRDFARSWRDGANMLVRTGTTSVADVEAVPALLPRVWQHTPLRVVSLLEMTGIRSRRRPAALLAAMVKKIDSLPRRGRCRAGLSPHAPYSTLPWLPQHAVALARRRRWPVAIHVAESATEFEMFQSARGEMFDWLRRNQRDMSDCGGVSPVQHLARHHALGPHVLAIHVNYLAPGDAALLARHGVSVVHCPRSHDYFRHAAFPYRALREAGVNVCLGTDSLATVRKHPPRELELNLFLEMRAFAAAHPEVAPAEILSMVTTRPARALRLVGRAGEIKPGAWADLIAIPAPAAPADLAAAVIHHTGPVLASMIAGRWVIPPP